MIPLGRAAQKSERFRSARPANGRDEVNHVSFFCRSYSSGRKRERRRWVPTMKVLEAEALNLSSSKREGGREEEEM